MSLLVTAFPLVERALAQLKPDEQITVEAALAEKLPAGHARKAEYQQKIKEAVSAVLGQCELHKVFETYAFDYETAAGWARQVEDPSSKILCFYNIAKKDPSKIDACRQEVMKVVEVIDEKHTLWLKQALMVEIAVELDVEALGEKHRSIASTREFHLRQAQKKIESDPPAALAHFRKALAAFRWPVAAYSEKLREKGRQLQSTAEAINRDWQQMRTRCAHQLGLKNPESPDAENKILDYIYSKPSLEKSYGDLEQRSAEIGDRYDLIFDDSVYHDTDAHLDLAKTIVQSAITAGCTHWEEYLKTYLDLIDCQSFELQRKCTRKVLRPLLQKNMPKAVEIAMSRTRQNMVTAQLALDIADADIDVDIHLLAKADSICSLLCGSAVKAMSFLTLAHCYQKRGMQQEQKRALQIAKASSANLGISEKTVFLATLITMQMRDAKAAKKTFDDLLMHIFDNDFNRLGLYWREKHKAILAKIKASSILHPYVPQVALDMLCEQFPRTEDECGDISHLQFVIQKHKKFESSKAAIDDKIASLYQVHIEKLSGITLTFTAEELQVAFPKTAKMLYEAGSAKRPRVDTSIAIAQLSGQDKDRLLLSLLQQFIDRENKDCDDLIKIITALA